MTTKPLALAACLLAVAALPVPAAAAPPSGAARAPKAPLGSVLERLALRTGADVLLDPALGPTRLVPSAAAPQSVSQTLESLRASIPDLSWTRLELPAKRPDVSPARLADLARSLTSIPFAELLVEHPGGRSASFSRRPGGADSLTSGPYLVYSVRTPAGSVPTDERMADLERQQLALPTSDRHLAGTYVGMMGLLQALPAEQRDGFMRRTVQAAGQLWETTPPEQRTEMMHHALATAQRGSAPPKPAAGPPPGRRPADPVLRLRLLCAELARRSGCLVVLDPDLFLAAEPAAPPRGLDIEATLDALLAPLGTVGWRRVRVSKAEAAKLGRRDRAADLVSAVHTLEASPIPEVRLFDPSKSESITFRSVRERTADQDAPAREGDAELYLVISEVPSAHGAGLEDRLGDLQRQQVELMLGLDAPSLARAMQGSIELYPSLGEAGQKRLLALPMMAGLMAGWMPRQAQENRR
jgi:hypothetical protein